jgi:hypothetical protein
LLLQEDNPIRCLPVIVSREGQKIYIEEARNAVELIIYLNDEMLDLDQNVDVEYDGEIIYSKKPERSITTIWETMYSRNDPNQVFSARIEVSLN